MSPGIEIQAQRGSKLILPLPSEVDNSGAEGCLVVGVWYTVGV